MKQILKKHKKSFILIGITVVLCSVLNTLHPYVIKEVINLNFHQSNVIKEIWKLIAVYAIIHILFAIFKNVRNIIVNKTVGNLLKEIRTQLFNKVLSLKIGTFRKYTSADIYTRLTVDVDNMATLFSDTMPVIINESLYLVFIVIMMFQSNGRLALIGIGTILTIAITVTIYVIKLKRIDDTILGKRDKLNKEYSELYDTNKLTYLFHLRKK